MNVALLEGICDYVCNRLGDATYKVDDNGWQAVIYHRHNQAVLTMVSDNMLEVELSGRHTNAIRLKYLGPDSVPRSQRVLALIEEWENYVPD